MVKTAAEIYRDGPIGDAYEPYKPDIREWGTWVEQIIAGFIANGGLVYTSRASLFADLARGANTSAWVIGDPTVAFNGVYRKNGASGTGSWTRVADLPYSFIQAFDAGAGTPNAIQATTAIPITESSLVMMNVFEANDGSPVTASFNGGSTLTLKTNTGNDIAAGGLVAGMRLLGTVAGSTFRLVNDQVASAIVAAAEAQANRAEAARDVALSAVPNAFPATIAALKALPTTTITSAYVGDKNEGGQFFFVLGNFTALAAREPFNYYKADDTALSAGAWVRHSDVKQKTWVVFATGQSNIQNHPAYVWTVPDNLYYWNSSEVSPGTILSKVSGAEITIANSYAAQLAREHPKDRVVAINVGRGSTAIANWLPSPPVIDMYAACKAAVEACLSYLGLSTIDEALWWQGESDWFANQGATYVADLEAVLVRFIGESWFPFECPVTFFTVSHQYTADTSLQKMNAMFEQIVRRQPQTRTLASLKLLPASYWDAPTNNLHLNGSGIDAAGRIGYAARHHGNGRYRTRWQTVEKIANESRVSTTTLANDDDLKFSMKAGKSYRIRGSVWFQSVTGADVKWGFTGPNATIVHSKTETFNRDAPTSSSIQMQTGSTYPTNRTIDHTVTDLSSVDFDLLVTGVGFDGLFAFQWAQNVSNAGTTRLFVGSYMEFIESF